MPKKTQKQKPVFNLRLGNKKITVTKSRLELFILVTLILSVVAAQVSGLYPYAYSYAKCKDAPLEVRGVYYRLPHDENYGIHIGSDYSRCWDGPLPSDLQRDPSTRAAARIDAAKAKEKSRIAELSNYDVYKPEGYQISSFRQSDRGDRFDTEFTLTTNSSVEFRVMEVKKGSSYDFTQQCSKPPEGNWSGTIIGVDTSGREICKINPNKYVQDYLVGIYIGNTAISLRAKSTASQQLDAEAVSIFSSMKKAS